MKTFDKTFGGVMKKTILLQSDIGLHRRCVAILSVMWI
jgi:hypothetical protein